MDSVYAIGQDDNGNIISSPGTPQSEIDAYVSSLAHGINPGNAMGQNTQTGIGDSSPSSSVFSRIGNSIPTPASALSGIIGWVDKTIPALGKADSMVGLNPNTPGSGIGGALSFITDIPRVTTTLLGLILIIAGIFALAHGPAVQIVSGNIKEAVTS